MSSTSTAHPLIQLPLICASARRPGRLGARSRRGAAVVTTPGRVRTIIIAALVAALAAAALAGGLTAPEPVGASEPLAFSNGSIDPDGPIGRS